MLRLRSRVPNVAAELSSGDKRDMRFALHFNDYLRLAQGRPRSQPPDGKVHPQPLHSTQGLAGCFRGGQSSLDSHAPDVDARMEPAVPRHLAIWGAISLTITRKPRRSHWTFAAAHTMDSGQMRPSRRKSQCDMISRGSDYRVTSAAGSRRTRTCKTSSLFKLPDAGYG